MFVPEQFKEDRIAVLHAAIRQAGLASLVTFGPDGLIASPVPLLLEAGPEPYGTLFGHLSRANPQWHRSAPEIEALAMFMGPDAYITPSWYPTKRATGKVVPTWNYVAIHAYGRLEFFDDADRLHALVTQLTQKQEAGRVAPWAVRDAPAEFIRSQLKGIVGFRLPIARLEGKWKMSQNRSAEDRAGVIEGLTAAGGPTEAAVAAAVADANNR